MSAGALSSSAPHDRRQTRLPRQPNRLPKPARPNRRLAEIMSSVIAGRQQAEVFRRLASGALACQVYSLFSRLVPNHCLGCDRRWRPPRQHCTIALGFEPNAFAFCDEGPSSCLTTACSPWAWATMRERRGSGGLGRPRPVHSREGLDDGRLTVSQNRI